MFKNIIIFVGGAAVGVAAGIFGTRKYFQKKADEEIQEMSEYFSKKNKEMLNMLEEPEDEANEKDTEEKITKDKKKTDYSKMYAKKDERKVPKKTVLTEDEREMLAAEMESPVEEDEREMLAAEWNCYFGRGDEETMEKAAKKVTEYHKKNCRKKPKIISAEAIGEIPAYYDHVTLFYYSVDEVVTDENDIPIDNASYLLGNALAKENFENNEEKIIFVQNFALDTLYEVQIFNMAFD